MSTKDVPGANAANKDVLAAGSWAEHDDGSLIFVKGTENDQVVFEIFDVAEDPPVSYTDAMRLTAFEDHFSRPPTGSSDEEWTWHDKTPFPWDRVMATFDRPRPQVADVHAALSAAARVAKSLRMRGREIDPAQLEAAVEQTGDAAAISLVRRFQKALDAFVEG